MERNQSNNGFVQKQNKGFTIHVGDTYVGHLVINEQRVDPATLANLQKPENMKAILANAELRIFVPENEREKRDTSDLDSIMADVNKPAKPVETAGAEAGADTSADADASAESPLGDDTVDADSVDEPTEANTAPTEQTA